MVSGKLDSGLRRNDGGAEQKLIQTDRDPR
jgi:hypothetical protein